MIQRASSLARKTAAGVDVVRLVARDAHIQSKSAEAKADDDACVFLRRDDFSSLSELTQNDALLFLVPLAKGKYQVKISPVWQVGHVGHSVRPVVTQRLEFALKLVRADDHDV